MWETIRGYLTFTRKERYGVLFLLLLISALFVSPFFFKRPAGSPDPTVDKKYMDGIMRFEKSAADSLKTAFTDLRNPSDRNEDGRRKKYFDDSFSGEMFYFDPNTSSAADWKNLGLKNRLIQTILRFIAKGGHFYKPEDLGKLYGLHDADYRRLLPYVRIKKPPGNVQAGFHTPGLFYNLIQTANRVTDSSRRFESKHDHSNPYYSAKRLLPTDINTADSADWCKLPGIGARLASRIIHFREKLGGFYAVDQVGETFGLSDSVFQKIKSCLHLNLVALQQIDLNNASKETLVSHPYIRWQTTKAILDYRVQHGSFKSVDELQQLVRMDPEKYQKIKPYLTINPKTNIR